MKTVLLHIICLLLLAFSSPLYAQVEIAGKVLDRQGHSVSDVNITVVQSFDSPVLIGYALSNKQGEYILKVSSAADSLNIIIRGFNVSTVYRKVPNISGRQDFRIEEKPIEIKEVIVKGRQIWQQKDTVNYLVSSFKDKNDTSIGDVLKKMPGIQVDNVGKISYMGVPINRFYIEGMDLMKDRYGIATNNLSPDDIATVQLLERHQPVKALKELRHSDQAAINLKMKEGAKGVWALSVLLGAGADFVPDVKGEGELTGFYFTRKRQHLAVGKSNNTGKDLEAEVKNMNGNEDESIWTDVIWPLPPPIDKSLYYDNETYLFTTNNRFKNKKEQEWSVDAYYLNDCDNRYGNSVTSYLLPDGTQNVITEAISAGMDKDRLTVNGNMMMNREDTYLNAMVEGEAEWRHTLGKVSNGNMIDQWATHKRLKAAGKINWIIKNDQNRGWEVNSSFNIQNTPQSLLVQPCLFGEILEKDGLESMGQQVELIAVSNRNNLSRLSALRWGGFSVTPSLFTDIKIMHLSSRFYGLDGSGYEKTAAGMENDADYRNLRAGGLLMFHYTKENLSFYANLPLAFRNNRLKQPMEGGTIDKNGIVFEPSASLTLDKMRWKFRLGYSQYSDVPDMQQLYSGYILSNYRNIECYSPDISSSRTHLSNLSIGYKDVFSMLFADVNLLYIRSISDMLYGQTFDGELSRTISRRVHHHGDIYRVKTNVGKGLDWRKTVLKLQGMWQERSFVRLRQDETVTNLSHEVALSGSLHTEPFDFVHLDWEGMWETGKSRIKGGEKFSAVSSLSNRVGIDLMLPQDIGISMSYYNYYTDAGEGGQSFSILNAGLQYTWKNIRFYLQWDNMLDLQSYTYFRLSGLDRYCSSYRIRPSTILFKVRFKVL